MQRLPNVYPLNIVQYPNAQGVFTLPASEAGSKLLIKNMTAKNYQLDFYNGSTDTISAWEQNYWILDGDTNTIGWTIDSDSLNVATPPISVVFFTIFGSQEKVPGTYPVFSIFQSNVGNAGGVPTTPTNVTNIVTLNGGTAGVVTLYEIAFGAIKQDILVFDGFQTGGISQPLVLGTSYTKYAQFRSDDIPPGTAFLKTGVLQNCSIVTALAAGGGTPTTQNTINAWSEGEVLNGFDTIRFAPNNVAPHTGILTLYGL